MFMAKFIFYFLSWMYSLLKAGLIKCLKLAEGLLSSISCLYFLWNQNPTNSLACSVWFREEDFALGEICPALPVVLTVCFMLYCIFDIGNWNTNMRSCAVINNALCGLNPWKQLKSEWEDTLILCLAMENNSSSTFSAVATLRWILCL